MTNEDSANMPPNSANAIAGAHQLAKRRLSLTSIGTDATSPRGPKRAVPPAPATRAVPTRGPAWCRRWGASPTTPPTVPVMTVHTVLRGLPPAVLRGLPPATSSCGAEVASIAVECGTAVMAQSVLHLVKGFGRETIKDRCSAPPGAGAPDGGQRPRPLPRREPSARRCLRGGELSAR